MKAHRCPKCGSYYYGRNFPKRCYVCKASTYKLEEVDLIDWEYELITNNENLNSKLQ